jgi:hypothetical protein
MAVEISSAPAASTVLVGAAAAWVAAVIVVAMRLKSVLAALISWGAALTNDMSTLSTYSIDDSSPLREITERRSASALCFGFHRNRLDRAGHAGRANLTVSVVQEVGAQRTSQIEVSSGRVTASNRT